MKRNRRSRRGFTLMEVLTGMGIFSIGILGSLGLMAWMARAGSYNARMVSAAAVGQAKLEEIRAQGYDQAASGSATDGQYQLSWTVNASNDGYKAVVLTVSWPSLDGATRELKLSNMLVQELTVAALPSFAQTGNGGSGGIPGGSGDAGGGDDGGGNKKDKKK